MPFKDTERAKEYNREYARNWRKDNIDESRRRSRESMRKWVAANPEKVREANRRLREKTKAWWDEYKSKLKCVTCGESHSACLDFHHRIPEEKTMNISHYSKSSWLSKNKLLAELEKCDVLCANCHRKQHYDEDVRRQMQ